MPCTYRMKDAAGAWQTISSKPAMMAALVEGRLDHLMPGGLMAEVGAKPAPSGKFEYVQISKVDSPAQGALANATEQKERAWKQVKSLRARVKDGETHLRLELIKAEDRWKEAKRYEDNAREQIEKDANKAGLTTKRGAEETAQPGTKVVSPDEFPTKEADASYSHISHMGSTRAAADRDAFVETIQGIYDANLPNAKTAAQKEALLAAVEKAKQDYLEENRRLMQVRSGTYSGFVAGGSKLNVKQANRGNSALDRALERFSAMQKDISHEVARAVRNARTPEEVAADLAAASKEKADNAAAQQAKNDAFLSRLLNFKAGDDLVIGSAKVVRINRDREGLPASITFNDGFDPVKLVGPRAAYKTKDDLREAVGRVKAAYPAGASLQNRNVADAAPEEAQRVQAAIEGKGLIEAARFMTQSDDKAKAAVAVAVLDKLQRLEAAGVALDLKIAHRGDMVPVPLHSGRGFTETGFDEKGRDIVVWLNGADVAGKVGTDEETLLHELVHAATTGMVFYGRQNPGTPSGQNVRDLMAVTDAIAAHISQRFEDADAGRATLTEFEKDMRADANNAFRSDDEVLAWALSSRDAQTYLEGIPYRSGGSLWSRFVSAVRSLLGLAPQQDTALSEVLAVADRLMTDDAPMAGRAAFWHKRGMRMVQQQGRGSIVQSRQAEDDGAAPAFSRAGGAMPATINVDGASANILRSASLAQQPQGITADDLPAIFARRFPKLAGAVKAMLDRGLLRMQGGLVVLDTNDEVQIAREFAERTGRDFDETVQMFESGDGQMINGFFDPISGLTFLVGPNLTDESAPAVVLHEAVHGQRRERINRRAMALIEGRAQAATPALRDFLTRVADRMEQVGESDNANEAASYIVELASKAGRQAGFSAAEGPMLAWIEKNIGKPVADLVRDLVAAVRAWALSVGVPLKTVAVDDLVAYAQAGVRKAAKGNVKVFLGKMPKSAAAGLEFSRSATLRSATRQATNLLNDTFSAPGKLSWWHKTVGTMYDLAERSPYFKPVFQAAQGFIDDVSHYANDAADRAPKLLPKLDAWRDIWKSPIKAGDNAAIAKPIFEGTLMWKRGADGRPVRVTDDEADEAGIVWHDSELRSMFGLNDAQVGLYREFRAATNRSLDSMARADMLRYGGKDAKAIRDRVMDARDLTAATSILRQHFRDLASADPDRAEMLTATVQGIEDRAGRAKGLMAKGYAPLSRFGKYTVDVVNADGKREYFGLFETAREANRMAATMREEFGAATVTQGTLSQEAFKLFAGITPETLELFGNALGLDSTGDAARDQAFQEYLRLTKSNRSAMKRMIHRQGIAGYSEDVARVLASFVYSNARQTAAGLNMGDLGEAVQAIPKAQGELKDAAFRLADYVKNPQEEAQAIRGLLFAQYLGGSIASAFVNMTQPVAVTFPWLSQYGGAKAAAAQLAKAATYMSKKRYEPDLARALHDAEEDGTVSPQEVHQLMAQAQGSGALRAGDGTRQGDALALASNGLKRLGFAWGKVFSMAEQVNRRVTFIAAYRTAVERGMQNPAQFARKAVQETQFVYCVDSQTECLTTSGWKTRDQLNPGDTVIGVDEYGRAIHTTLKDVHVFPGRQAINSFTGNRKFNMMVTDGHDCLVQHFDNRLKKWSRVLKRKAVDLRPGHQLLRAPTAPVERDRWIGDDMAALLGWVAAEGNYAKFRNCTKRTNVRITQSIAHNPEYVQEIEALLERLGGHYRKFSCKGGTMAIFTLKEPLSGEVRRLMPDKLIAWEFAERMPFSEMRATLDAFSKGDGHLLKEGGWIIGQKAEQNLDVLQAMAVLTGQNATIYPKRSDKEGVVPHLYLHVNSLRSTVSKMKCETVYVDDGVWCPETECGTWIARRQGAVFATGNSKASKMEWGRGAIGGTLMTFKTYSIAYLELLHRMATQGGPEGKRAALLALGVLMLMGGVGGLPFAGDAEDVAEALARMLGYNVSLKKARQELLEDAFGRDIAGFIDKGITGLPGVPLDVSSRLGMGNLIPGTGLLQPKTSHTSDMLEIVGPAGDLAKRGFSAAGKLLQGDVAGAALEAAPTAARNLAKGADMAATGMYRDAKGYKVLDTNVLEAALKAIGFQPQSVAAIQDANAEAQQAKNFYNLRAQEIRAKWAAGIFEQDQAKVQEARDEIADWNRKNPDQRMAISVPSVLKRVQEMRKSKDERIAATAPKAMRAQLKEDFAKVREGV